jgi:hypothetical protein
VATETRTIVFCLKPAHDLDLVVEEFQVRANLGHERNDIVDQGPSLIRVDAHAGDRQGKTLPSVAVHAGVLGNRNVETASDPLGNTARGLPSSLEAAALRDPEADVGYGDVHGSDSIRCGERGESFVESNWSAASERRAGSLERRAASAGECGFAKVIGTRARWY